MQEVLDKLSEISASQREMNVILKTQGKTLEKHANLLELQQETLIRNTITVEEHHKRSIALENRQKELEAEIEPIRDHVISVQAVFKAMKWFGIFFGAVLSAASVYRLFF